MNPTAGRRPYPQGCGRTLWIPRQRSQRQGLARPKVGLTVSLSTTIQTRLTALPNVTLSPNKYTSWGKLCGLRWEMQADLGIDCGRYAVLPSCTPSFAGLCAGAVETVFHLELRIRQLSPASTQPTTTYLYIFVLQDRQVIDTGAPGDNSTPGPRLVAAGRHPSERGPDLCAARGRRRGWQEQMISPAHTRPEHFAAGVVVPRAHHVGVWLTKQTISSRPSPFSWISRPGPAIARPMASQPGGMRSAYPVGLPHRRPLRSRAELHSIRARMLCQPQRNVRTQGGSCRTAAVSKTGAGGAAGLMSVRKRQTRHPVTRPLAWLCDYSRRRFL
jgi:hypothetical protein